MVSAKVLQDPPFMTDGFNHLLKDRHELISRLVTSIVA
jgi:hypothetical protein